MYGLRWHAETEIRSYVYGDHWVSYDDFVANVNMSRVDLGRSPDFNLESVNW